ncbi:SCP2 sterol-binding domain-containing protein [Azospirillum rugosum]|uniref:Sterol carrier protein n=1 Tax=Azospirillum rugosum TaxID=416170 RepID=A0ABS4SEF5_9PROT|nr:SCP2 sterol-binding domain-containing protein [Azospirillum rugosum]MBP2290958.1 putative sterol carrier protein [Azospirillum rugosum]MDQ0524978.1 putative sterol carrier protein [Azospirillum rugosum]
MVEDILRELQARSTSFRGLKANVRFAMEDDAVVRVDARETPVAIRREEDVSKNGAAEDADCTIRISAENLKKLMDGRLNPMLAFTMGKLKVDGSMGVAMKLAQLLDE